MRLKNKEINTISEHRLSPVPEERLLPRTPMAHVITMALEYKRQIKVSY